MQELEGKVAVITGGASGIGRAMGRAFGAAGMRVALADIEAGALDEARRELEGRGVEVAAFRCDVSQADSVAKLAEDARAAFGSLHVVCNNAGVLCGGSTWATSLNDYEWVMSVNVWGVIHGIRTFVPLLLEQGEPAHVVNTASMAGLTVGPMAAAYFMSKHAVVSLSESLYHELAAIDGCPVRVSVVCPEVVNTGIFQAERNRPAHLKRDAADHVPEEARQLETGGNAMAASGVDPSVLAERTLSAIRENRFWVLPPEDDPWREATRARNQHIESATNPTLSRPLAQAEEFPSMDATIEARLKSVPFRMTDPERVPVQRYYDEEFFQLECEHLWPHVWQMACRLEQIPEVGDWIEYSNLGTSVIIVHTKAGIRAFHNACRHRGVSLVAEGGHGNCRAKGFTCPFHGWRWNADGENTFIYGEKLFSDELLDRADLALRPCRVELWAGCAFINLDDDAPSLRESLGPVTDRLEAHGASKLRAEWWYGTVLPANWKIAMEAFMEGYHVMRTHPQLHAAGSLYSGRYEGGEPNENITTREAIQSQLLHLELLSEGMAGMCHAKEVEIARNLMDVELPDDPEQAVPLWYGMLHDQITKQLRSRGEDVPDLNAVAVSDPVSAVEFLFPHYFLLPFFTSMSSYRIRPLGPESCFFEIWSLTMFPEGQEPEPPMEPTVLPYDSEDFPPIPQQDYSNIPRQQKGLHATGFEFMRLSKDVEGLISNYQRIIDGYIAGLPPERLARANQALGGNFDGKILDIGL